MLNLDNVFWQLDKNVHKLYLIFMAINMVDSFYFSIDENTLLKKCTFSCYYELKTSWVELLLAKKLNVFVGASAPEHIIFLAEMSGFQLVNEFLFLS